MVEIETKHMHHNRAAIDCNVAIVLAAVELLTGASKQEAYLKAKTYITNSHQSESKAWLEEMERDEFQSALTHIGWVKIAFQQALYHLKQEIEFEEALSQVISLGGDTDTNGCILGMLLGCHQGFNKLPDVLLQKVLHCDSSLGLHKRDHFLHPREVEGLLLKIMSTCEFKIAPTFSQK